MIVAGAPLMGFALVTPNMVTAESDPDGAISLNGDLVVKFNNSSSVAINPYWLLTAAHVADDAGHSSVVVDGVTYNQVDEVYHPTADLALVKLDAPLPGYFDMYTGTYPEEEMDRKEGVLIGYGGVGAIPDATNYTVSSTGRGTLRWGYNKIDDEVVYVGGTGKTNSGLRMFFDTADSANEAGVGIGDSGGGVMILDGGVWKVAGIMVDASTGTATDSVLAVNIQDYEAWINATVPELPPWMLAGGFLALLGVAQRWKRGKSTT